MSLKQSGEFDTGCGSIAYEKNNEGYFHAAALVAVATTFITCLVLFGIHSTSREFTSAGYLQFTYRLEKMFAYRIVARSLMVFACGAYVAAVPSWISSPSPTTSLESWLATLWWPMGGVISSL